MVLFAYLVSHFLNHALGNISMEALARGVYIHTLFWQFLPVTIVFYTACLVHAGLGDLGAVRAPAIPLEGDRAAAAGAGPEHPALIIAHIVGVRLGQTLFEHEKLYPQEFYLFFVAGSVAGCG